MLQFNSSSNQSSSLFIYAPNQGVEPDIRALAKGIGEGFPLGACLATEKAAKYMAVGMHGSTFSGNPLATSVGKCCQQTGLNGVDEWRIVEDEEGSGPELD